MRRVWWNAVAVTAALAFGGACAAGTDDGGAVSSVWGMPGDAGDSSSNPQGNPPDSGNGSADTSPPDPPATTDSGGMPPTMNDAAVPPNGQDSGPPMVVDSGTDAPATQPDSGPPPTGGTTCPNTLKYFLEYSAAPSGATVCTSGAQCTSSQCCYGANVGSGLCVKL